MKHWSAEFQPRSLCSFDGGPDSGPGDSSAGPPGDTGGDFFGSSDGSFFGTNDSGNIVGSDTFGPSTGGDTFTGSETGASQFASSDPGAFFGDSSGPVSSDTSGSFFGGGPDGGSSFMGSGGADGFIGPNSDFGYSPGDGWGPTGGVDYAGGPFMSAGLDPSGNLGFGNAMGPPGWATGDFGMQGYGGPTGTGAGPGSTASIGGPGAYGAPSGAGINGFPGDFGAPPGGAFGMPNQGDVGPQAGPGILGGPTTVQQGEALNPSLFGPEVTSPEVTRPSDDRTEVDPSTVFGPEVTANAGWFGPSQAQAASRGTDTEAMMLQSDPFAQVAMMANQVAQTNPDLAQALAGIVANQNNQTNMIGPTMTGFEGPSPGAQQGFTGTSAQQGTTAFDSFGGKGDSLNQSGRADVQQTNPNFDQIGPMVTQQGYQQLAAEMNAQQPQTPTVQGQQQDTFDSRFNAVESPNQAVQNAFDALGGKPATSDTFDSRFGEMQTPAYDPSARPAAETQQDTFDSRFGNLPTNEQQAPGLAPPGQLGPGMVMADPTVTPGQQQFGDAIPGTQFAAPSRGSDQAPPWSQGERGPIESEMETIGRAPNEDVISSLLPATLNAGGGIGIPGLLSMYGGGTQADPSGRPGGSPTGNPSQAGVGPFGPSSGRPGGDTSGRPGLSITVGGNQQASGRPGGGYYQTGGAGIAPGAKGAEYGGAYGVMSPGRPGTSAFGGDFRQGGGGGAYFYDPATGQYFVR